MRFTIVDSMIEHAQLRPEATAFRYISDLVQAPDELNYAQLLQAASGIAHFLREQAEPGSRVMLFFPPGMDYIKAFFGCLLAGMVAVPLYPPRRNVKSDRIVKVAQSCQSVLALTTASELATVQGAWDEQNTLALPLTLCAVDAVAPSTTVPVEKGATDPAAVAFLQYTSGSTGVPKGVIVTHENIIANMLHLSLMSTGNKDDVFVNWLPLFHDLGLVTAVLWPVYLGASSNLMAPATFVRDPVIWLRTITRYRGTMCGSPSFAFDLCNKKIAAADLATLDLSSWRIAYNAAEPVRSDVIAEFTARFAACGFRTETFYPSYGMAEATVFISGGDAEAKPIHLTVDKVLLAGDKLELVDASHPRATNIVACGAAYAPHDIRIVDPQTCRALPDGTPSARPSWAKRAMPTATCARATSASCSAASCSSRAGSRT
jgi:acyl-CoA synthetase (AMP-forming)/AMP-acid ligase II